MSLDAALSDTKAKLDKAIQALQNDFKHIRTGRATPAMIEHVQVEAYGAPMPITQCASISVPEPTTLVIKPWDRALLKAIEKGLNDAQLGMAPQSDGQIIRLNLPPLSTERRQQLVGQAKEATEKCKVAMRNIRRDAMKAIETKAKADKLPEDLVKKTNEKIQDLLKAQEGMAEKLLKEKADDILRI